MMSQKKKVSRVASLGRRSEPVVPEEEEEDDVTFTQPSTSQVQRGLQGLAPAQLDQKTAEVVQYFLIKDQKKIPIRRAGVVKEVLKEYRNIYPEIMRRAERIFNQVYGLQVVEIDPKTHVYILINKLQRVEGAPLSISPSTPKTGLLFVILGLVFMKGGVIKENLLWNTLKKLRVDPGEKHEEFGEVRRVVTEEFVRQRYLEHTRVPHTEPAEFEIRWGQRANVEVSKVKLLEVMGQLHDQDPKSWTQQYREAMAPPPNSAPGAASQRQGSQR